MDHSNFPPPGFLSGPRTIPYHPDDWSQPSLSEHVDNELARLRNLAYYPRGEVILTFPESPGTTISVPGLNASLIEDRSPLLAVAFESSISGLRLHLEALSPDTVIPFIRFLYTPSYGLDNAWADVPTSVLLHCKMYHLGELYDIAALKSQAYVNVLRQCEYGCSAPEKPIDLYKAISFAYSTLNDRASVTDAIVQYCVTCCLCHKLHENAEFKKLVFNIKAFNQDLVKVCMQRGYEDESAAVIIRLPYKPFAADTFASTENPAMEDVIHHFHSTDRFDLEPSPKKKQRVTPEDVHESSKKAVPTQLCEKRGQAIKASFRPATDTPIFADPHESSAIDSTALPIRPLQSITEIGNKSHTQASAMKNQEQSDIIDWTSTHGIPIRPKAGNTDSINPSSPQPLRGDLATPLPRQNTMALQNILCTGPDAQGGLLNTKPRNLAEAKEASIKASHKAMKMCSSSAESYSFQKQPVSEPKKMESTIFSGGQAVAADRSAQVVASARPQQQRRDSLVQLPVNTENCLPSATVQTSKVNAYERASNAASNGRSLFGKSSQNNTGSFAPSNASPTLPAFEPYRTAQSGISAPTMNVTSSVYAKPGSATGNSATNKATSGPNHALQDYQMQLMLLEEQNKKRNLTAKLEQEAMKRSPPHEKPEPEAVAGAEVAQQDYEHRLRTLEAQNKKRLLMAKEEADRQMPPHEEKKPPKEPESARQNYELQLKMLEAQNKKRLLMAKKEADREEAKSRTPLREDSKPHPHAELAKHDYKQQLEMLEAERKHRLLVVREEVESRMPPRGDTKRLTDAELGLQDYALTLRLLEINQEKRLLMARQEMDSRMPPTEVPTPSGKERTPVNKLNLQECQEQLAGLEAQGKIRCKLMTGPGPVVSEATAAPETAISLNPREKIGFDAFPGRGICRFVCLPDSNGKCTDCGSTELERNTYLQKQKRIQDDHFDNFDHGVSRATEHLQGLDFEFPTRDDDVLDSFDFDTFLNTDTGSFDYGFSTFDYPVGSTLRTPEPATSADPQHQANATADHTESDIDMCDSDADSDVSWIDVDMKSTQATTSTTNSGHAATAAVAAAGSQPAPASAKRSSSTFEEDDDEWDLC